MTDAQIKALIARGITDALAERNADMSINGDDSHDLGGGGRRRMPVARECTYTDFLKRVFPEEFDEVEKYVGGLPDMIHSSVMASKPKTMQDAIEFATELMDQKIHTTAERQAKNKRKLDDNNQTQQQPLKKQNVARAYSAGSSEKKESRALHE
nr:reverse transcriptase domain-containing protein [Tanacetum cinerariifolium]